MVFQVIAQYYGSILNSGDLRSVELPFVRDPIYMVTAAIVYLVIVFYGPRFMEKREALKLREVLVGYNFLSVLLSVWMLWEFIACSFLNPDFNLFCQDIVESDRSPLTMRLVNAHWWYSFSKVIEFLDTFFFIVRKKNKQISFLHVYHHISMLILQWSLVKYVPGGVSYFGPLCNCFIHSLMYTYYMLSAVGPHMQKYLWWKKYLTKMQMYQFMLIFLYCANALSYSSLDKQSRGFLWLFWLYMISLFWLFNHFYQNAYNAKKEIDDVKKCKSS